MAPRTPDTVFAQVAERTPDTVFARVAGPHFLPVVHRWSEEVPAAELCLPVRRNPDRGRLWHSSTPAGTSIDDSPDRQ
jgi:hypothetical protein